VDPTVIVVDLRKLIFGLAAIGDGERDRGSDHDAEYALVRLDPGALAASHVTAKIDDLDPVEPLAHHLAQSGIGPAGQELAVGDKGDDAPLRSVLSLEELPDRPAPERRTIRERC
jgi:hypothetical protein